MPINILDAQVVATRGLHDTSVTDDRNGGRGRLSGYSDPNPQITPWDLYGSGWGTGIYDEMSRSHPIIASALRTMADSIADLDRKIVPSGDTVDHRLAAAYCQHMVDRMVHGSFRSWIWEAVYHTSVGGHVLHEIVVDNDARLSLRRVRSASILEFKSDHGVYQGASVQTNTASVNLPAGKSVLISAQDHPGHWWGTALLRPLVATYQAYKATLQNFIASQRNSKGFLVAKETGETTQESWMAIQRFLTDFYNNVDSPLILDRSIDMSWMETSSPALREVVDMYDRYDATVREYLMDTINSLGMHGSRALGSEYRASDANKFAKFVSLWEERLNGSGHHHSSLLYRLCEIGGFSDPASVVPRIELVDTTEVDLTGQIETLISMVTSGLVTREDLGEERVQRILSDLGYGREIVVNG